MPRRGHSLSSRLQIFSLKPSAGVDDSVASGPGAEAGGFGSENPGP